MSINTITANKVEPISDRVLVTDMYFGEQKTTGGIIISNDDGKTRGIYPRWAKVYDKGPSNNDPYKIGDWILVEHGRWTRGATINIEDSEIEIRMVEAESILGYSTEKPDAFQLGAEYGDAQAPETHRPENFM